MRSPFSESSFFVGDIAHNADEHTGIGIVNHGLLDKFFIFSQIGALIPNRSTAVFHLKEYGRIQNADDGFTENIGGRTDIHDPAGGGVDRLNLKIFVQHDQTVGGILDDGVRKAFGLIF